MVRRGVLGRLVSFECTAPHQIGPPEARPDWFWDRARSGGILADLGTHQADQFLTLVAADAASRDATPPAVEVEWAATRPDPTGVLAPSFDASGSMMLSAGTITGYARVDWWTPDGLGTWGDGRLTLVGTEATIEVRKHLDPAGRPGGDHLLLTDRDRTRHHDCSEEPLRWARDLLDAVQAHPDPGTDAAHMFPHGHRFRASELALVAQAMAEGLRARAR